MDIQQYVAYRHELVKESGIAYDKTKISSPDMVVDYARKMFEQNKIGVQEQFYVIYLNHANQIIGHTLSSTGGITSCLVDIRLVMKGAIDLLATGIITVHNHPSGTILPSNADKALAKKISEACSTLEIRLLDSLIITEDDYASY